ncbi:sigma-70 family RNA polymerase sigma factor [Acidobacteria bacterium AH-259-D05]|nr:sigma-70 family RNA polymerase sigma factor [Acidobacteria bacterium AH-259-D05]
MNTKELEQHQVIQGIKSGDSVIIDDFVQRFSRPLFGVILNYTKNPSDAEEILQDTLLRVIRKIDTFREESDIWPWIKRIAVNNSIMWLRKNRSARRREVQLEASTPQFSEDGYLQDSVFRWSVDPEDVMLNSELAGQLYEAIQSLPFEYRVPLVLKDVEGYPIKQIASLLGLKEATAKTRIHRARLFIRAKMANYLEGRL